MNVLLPISHILGRAPLMKSYLENSDSHTILWSLAGQPEKYLMDSQTVLVDRVEEACAECSYVAVWAATAIALRGSYKRYPS